MKITNSKMDEEERERIDKEQLNTMKYRRKARDKNKNNVNNNSNVNDGSVNIDIQHKEK